MRTIPGRWLASLCGASTVLTIALLHHAREQVSLHRPLALAIVAAILFAGWLRYDLRNGGTPEKRIARDLAEYLGLFGAMALVGAIASYPDAATSSGFADRALLRIDRLLGFNWIAWYRLVAAHPALQVAGRIAYESIFVSPAVLLAYQAWNGQAAEARSFLLAFWIATVVTLLLFPHLAAVGPLAFCWHGTIPYMPASALYQMQLIPALRSHAVVAIDAAALRGLVAAPSFHATSAVLYAAFAWRAPRLRWPLVALNGAMLLATPVEGTHYLSDIILGTIVAVVAIAAARLAARLATEAGNPLPSGLLTTR